MSDDGLSRRRLLAYGGGGAALLGAGALGATRLLGGDDGTTGDGQFTAPDETTTTEAAGGDGDDGEDTEGIPAIVERYAPTLRYGRFERWFPTDPSRYASDRDGERVVDGFDALDSYHRERRETGALPAPTVFYRLRTVPDAPLTVVQYWMYSAFDQFATNFHWHDWELLQVFVDTDRDRPVLLSASAHSRSVPNNEYRVDGDETIDLGILSEVGSHSSTTTTNRQERTFQRLPQGDGLADITNAALDLGETLGLPLAYGLPRDEGGVLPYVVPELDGAPLYEHPDLPNVRAADLIDAPLAVSNLDELTQPPGDIPVREHATTLAATDGEDVDEVYELQPMETVADIATFTGPQLSFPFAIPTFVEDQFASHLTSVTAPWEQPRYTNPVADVTDRGHRAFIEETYLGGSGSDLPLPVGTASAQSSPDAIVFGTEAVTSGSDGALPGAPDGAAEAFADDVAVSVTAPVVEGGVLLRDGEGASVATPTVGGVARFVDIGTGERELVVNGAGYAPHAERISHEGGVTTPGERGRVSLVERRDARKLRGELSGLDRVRIDEDYAGPVRSFRPTEDGRFGSYVHRSGAYSLEVRDRDGGVGVFRVRPGDGDDSDDSDDDEGPTSARTVALSTGAEPIAGYLVEWLEDARGLSDRTEAGGVTTAFDAAIGGAQRSLEALSGAGGDPVGGLEALRDRLARLEERIEAARGDALTDAQAAVLLDRVGTADRRARQALDQL